MNWYNLDIQLPCMKQPTKQVDFLEVHDLAKTICRSPHKNSSAGLEY